MNNLKDSEDSSEGGSMKILEVMHFKGVESDRFFNTSIKNTILKQNTYEDGLLVYGPNIIFQEKYTRYL